MAPIATLCWSATPIFPMRAGRSLLKFPPDTWTCNASLSGYAYVRGQIHHDRPDSSVLIFRSQESRTTHKPDSVPTDAGAGLPRKAGSIAVSNSGYGRYEGELEIARVDLPGDERMNVAGHITPEAMELLPFIKRGFGVRSFSV